MPWGSGDTVAWLSHPEPPELLAGSPVEGQRVASELAQLGHRVQILVFQLVVECLDAEVFQGPSREWSPCGRGLGGRLWDGQGPALEAVQTLQVGGCLQEEAHSGHCGEGWHWRRKAGSGRLGAGEEVAVAAEKASSVGV